MTKLTSKLWKYFVNNPQKIAKEKEFFKVVAKFGHTARKFNNMFQLIVLPWLL